MIVWFDKACIERIMTTTDARTMVASLRQIINTLVQAAAVAALKGDVKAYKYDDTMTKTSFEYADAGAIAAQIKALISLQEIYLQMPGMNSRITRLIDIKNMPALGPINSLLTITS